MPDMEKINRLIASRERLFDRLDVIAKDFGIELDGLDMMSPEALFKLAEAIKDVGHATQALEWAES